MGQVPPKYFLPSSPYGSSPAASALNPVQPAAVNPQTPLLPPTFSDPGTMATQSPKPTNPVAPIGRGSGPLRGLFGLLLLLFAPSLWATTAVTGTLQNLGTQNVTNGAFVRFWLRGCGGNIPRVNGVAVIAPSQGGVYFFDFAANASGQISGTLYSTRDVTGNLGGDIECGGSKTAVWYGMQVYVGGKGASEVPIHAKNTSTIDISNVTPINTFPVSTAPNPQGTFLRLDGGNSPLTGPVTSVSTISDAGGTHTGADNLNAGGTLSGIFTGNRTETGNNTHSGTETFTGPLTATAGQNNLNFYQLNGGSILWWDGVKYPYTTAGLQQILADCLSITICEQVHLEGAGARTVPISSTVSFGSTTKSLTIFFSRSWNPNCTITNGTDCFVVHAGTTFVGNGAVPITTPQGMTFASNASISAAVRVIDQDGTNNVGGWLDGLTIIPNATMTVSDAILSVQNPFQIKTLSHVSFGGGSWPSGVIGAKVFCTTGKGCSNVSFTDVQFDTEGNGKPVWIGCTSVGSTTLVSCLQIPAVSFSGSATVITHPIAGSPIVDIEQGDGAGGTNPGVGQFFDHPQLESSHNTDIGILCNGCAGLTVNGLSATAVVAGADLIKLAQPAGTTLDGVNISGVTNQGLWTNTVNNTVISDTVPGSTACGNGCSYHYHKNFSATATEVWSDGTGRIATKGQNGFSFARGIGIPLASGTALQIFNTTTTCTTGASAGATCTTAAITLPVAEADTNYRVVCTGKGLTNVPVVIATTNTSGTQFTITIAALTAAAASFSSYDCTVGHN